MRVSVGITGASGALLARELLLALEEDERVEQVDCVPSESSLRVAAEELHLGGRGQFLEKLLGAAPRKTVLHAESDIGAGIASGSYPSRGMIVLPCSMGTLASIANGLAQNLITRAADVCLKEQRPLILSVRETPLNRIHLRNMALAADAGAVIFPVVPAFYDEATNAREMARQYVFRVLQHFGLPQQDMFRWKLD